MGGSMGKTAGVVAALAFLLAVAVVGGVVVRGQSADIARQSREITAQAKRDTAQEKEIGALQNSVATLLGQVANPTDPLGAYNQICNQTMQNGTTGVDQTFYFPCTNNAQTTPQPGN